VETKLFDAAIYQRTALGRRAALDDSPHLSPHARRILLMINGFTPLERLKHLSPQATSELVVEGLVRDGLIEPVVKPLDTP
jgi:hypothetical protein